jgi:hypothetical protein
MLNFLIDAPVTYGSDASGAIAAGVMAFILGMLVALLIIGAILWVYTSFAYMAIAKKAKQDMPGLAWIPGVGPMIIAFQTADMPWWPWLLLIGMIIPILGFIALLVFAVYAVIWQWKMFEKIGKPGWWSILCLITPLNLIFWGIAAWSKD